MPLAVSPDLLSYYKEPKQCETVNWAFKLQTSRLAILSIIAAIKDAEIQRESATLLSKSNYLKDTKVLASRNTLLTTAVKVRVIIDIILFKGLAQTTTPYYKSLA